MTSNANVRDNYHIDHWSTAEVMPITMTNLRDNYDMIGTMITAGVMAITRTDARENYHLTITVFSLQDIQSSSVHLQCAVCAVCNECSV